jgi:hypothetical protein
MKFENLPLIHLFLNIYFQFIETNYRYFKKLNLNKVLFKAN